VHIAVLDIAKAFDLVSHDAIYQALRMKGRPDAYVSYIKKVYEDAHRVLQLRGKTSPPVHTGRGTRQRDPQSTLNFNIVLVIALSKLNPAIGFKLSAPDEPLRTINRFGYADDMILRLLLGAAFRTCSLRLKKR
jgi:hypothetical protein